MPDNMENLINKKRNNDNDLTGLFVQDYYYDQNERKKYISLREIEMDLITNKIFNEDQMINLRDTFPSEKEINILFENNFYIIPVPKITSREKLISLYQKETDNSLGKLDENFYKLFTTNVEPGWYAIRFKEINNAKSKDLAVGNEQDIKTSNIKSNVSIEFMLWFTLFRRMIPAVQTETETQGLPVIIYTTDSQNKKITHIVTQSNAGAIAEIIGPFPKGINNLKTLTTNKTKQIEYGNRN